MKTLVTLSVACVLLFVIGPVAQAVTITADSSTVFFDNFEGVVPDAGNPPSDPVDQVNDLLILGKLRLTQDFSIGLQSERGFL